MCVSGSSPSIVEGFFCFLPTLPITETHYEEALVLLDEYLKQPSAVLKETKTVLYPFL